MEDTGGSTYDTSSPQLHSIKGRIDERHDLDRTPNLGDSETTLAEGNKFNDDDSDEWRDLKIMHLWCDKSAWAVPYGVLELRAEIANAKSAAKAVRNIHFVRSRGANHFVSSSKFEELYLTTHLLFRRIGTTPSRRSKHS